jgi:hypothetical protein
MTTQQELARLQADLDQREAALLETVRNSTPQAIDALRRIIQQSIQLATNTPGADAFVTIDFAASIALDHAILQAQGETQ